MSRGKLRKVSDFCGDCGSAETTWASLNKGIFICHDCCSVHRTLGRHISQVKSLQKGIWNLTQLTMVSYLHASGANNVWEHSLLDPSNAKSGRRKPSPNDPIHPVKADFIRAKHQMLAFVYRPNKESNFIDGDLSKQLHSSVRTANLETSLKLLSLGADPNFFHIEKGYTTLHVAAKAGQSRQVELLLVYGADPAASDSKGETPVDYAKSAGHEALADRLLEAQFELTDRLAFYLCGRKPDHASSQHFIIPEMADGIDKSDLAKNAKKQLQNLSNALFEELAMDVYDEVDRRENDAVWLSLETNSKPTTDRCNVPFLPVNQEYSSTRNQGRQKLARLNAREFATLLIDVLSEAKRRQFGGSLTTSKGDFVKTSSVRDSLASDEEPLYDSVASDEDYVILEQHFCNSNDSDKSGASNDEKKVCTPTTPSSDNTDVCSTSHEDIKSESCQLSSKKTSKSISRISFNEFLEMKQQLLSSENKVIELIHSNNEMKQEIGLLQNMVFQLIEEQKELSGLAFSNHCYYPDGDQVAKLATENIDLKHCLQDLPQCSSATNSIALFDSPTLSPMRSPRSCQRPVSMFEPRELNGTQQNFGGSGVVGYGYLVKRDEVSVKNLPSGDEVIHKTEQITKKIQELLKTAQDGKIERFHPCAQKIEFAVTDMLSIFPKLVEESNLKAALRQLINGASCLRSECEAILDYPEHVDSKTVIHKVMQFAYDIAKAAKVLVTLFQ